MNPRRKTNESFSRRRSAERLYQWRPGHRRSYASEIIDKPTFGSTALGERLRALNEDAPIESITLIGLCTDICVISNALLLRAYLPEIPIIVDAACCAGVTPESHRTALAAMRACQIIIENEPSI